MTRRAALFDLDRTLVLRETATLYVQYQRRIGEASTRDLLRTMGWVLQYTFGTLDAARVAEKALAQLAGQSEAALEEKCEAWFASDVEKLITNASRKAVLHHLDRGDVCAIVTGSSPYAARPCARRLGIPHVVSSVFEVDDVGNFTGRPVYPICLGKGKLERAEAFAKEHDLDLASATFYTDSVSDLPLLERVGHPVAVNPDARLRRIAQARSWPIENWT